MSPSVKLPTGMTLVLDMLHFSPEISQKRLSIFTAEWRFFSDFSKKKVQSSAKPEALSSNFAYFNPVVFLVFVIFISRISTIRKKISHSEDMKHPYPIIII